MVPRYRVTLTPAERAQLEALTRSGKASSAKFIHARALLLCDAGPLGDPWKVAEVAAALGVTTRTIEHLKDERYGNHNFPDVKLSVEDLKELVHMDPKKDFAKEAQGCKEVKPSAKHRTRKAE